MLVNFIRKNTAGVKSDSAVGNNDGLDFGIDALMSETIEDVNESAQKYINRRYGKVVKVCVFAYVIWVVGVLALLFFISDQISAEDMEGALSLIGFPLVIYPLFVARIKGKMVRLFYKQFADVNGFNYKKTVSVNGFTGALFKVGRKKRVYDVVQGTFNGHALSIFNYSYETGYGRYSKKHNQTVFEIDFDVTLPPILLLTDWNDYGDNLSDNNLNRVSKIKLPEKIEKHFDLFAEKKYEIEALQIFTPDILAYLYDNYKGFSYDFTGHKFYLYSKKLITTKAELYKAYKLTQFIITRLSKELKRMGGSTKAMDKIFNRLG